MTSRQPTLFDGARLQMNEAIDLTISSLAAYGTNHRHWAIAWSGGKDSTALLVLVIHLILSGRIDAPETLTVLYADTRMELPPLWHAAASIREELIEKTDALAAKGCALSVQSVMAPLDRRYLVYMLGRGVPPPNNGTLRWCTEKIKIEPMAQALAHVAVACGLGQIIEKKSRGKVRQVYQGFGREKLLVLTGVRQGESAIRDGRIAMSCSKGDAECGQGWYQETLPTALCDTLAPLLHWRVCHVWALLKQHAPTPEFGDWTTAPIADAYGGDEAEESGARTGCVGCPLTQEDKAGERIYAMPRWSYLTPLRRLKELYRELRTFPVRLRKRGGETRKDGSLVPNQHRVGPITLDGRRKALAVVVEIQREINEAAERLKRPRVDILNEEERARIEELIAANTWPDKWDGTEPLATDPFEEGGQGSLFDDDAYDYEPTTGDAFGLEES